MTAPCNVPANHNRSGYTMTTRLQVAPRNERSDCACVTWISSAGITIPSRPPGRRRAIDARTNGTQAFVCFVNLQPRYWKIFPARTWKLSGRYWYRMKGGLPTTASKYREPVRSPASAQPRKSDVDTLVETPSALARALALWASLASISNALMVKGRGDAEARASKKIPSPQLGSRTWGVWRTATQFAMNAARSGGV